MNNKERNEINKIKKKYWYKKSQKVKRNNNIKLKK